MIEEFDAEAIVLKSSSDRIASVAFSIASVSGVVLIFFGDILIGATCCVVFAVIAVWFALSKLVINSIGIRSVKAFQPKQTLKWSEIDRFKYRGSLYGVCAKILGKRWVSLQNYGRFMRPEAESVVARLEAARERHAPRGPEIG